MKNFKINKRLVALFTAGALLSGTLTACRDEKKRSEEDEISTYISENDNEEYNFYDIISNSQKNIKEMFSYVELLEDKNVLEIAKFTISDNGYALVNEQMLSASDFEKLINEYSDMKKKNKIITKQDGVPSFDPVVYEIRNQTGLITEYIHNNINRAVMDYIYLVAQKYVSEMIPGVDPLGIEISYTINNSNVESVIMVPEIAEMYYIHTSFEEDINNYNKIIGHYDNVGYMEKYNKIDMKYLKYNYDEVNKIFVKFISREKENKIKTITK